MNNVWKKLIITLIEKEIRFDLVNNVLSFKGMPEEVTGLWYWFDEVRVAEKGDKFAGNMLILDDFKFDDNNELIIFTRGR